MQMPTTFVDAFEDGDLEIDCGKFVNITTRGAFRADPDAADAIASALHVAAAQVRQARGEQADDDLTRPMTVGGEPHLAMRVEMGCPLDRTTVAALHAELGAWLAAQEVAK